MIVSISNRFSREIWLGAHNFSCGIDASDSNLPRLKNDQASPGTVWYINHDISTYLLVQLTAEVVSALGRLVHPKQSILRVVTRGQLVEAHVDGNPVATEIFAMVPLYSDADSPWPFIVERDGRSQQFFVEVGQMVIVRGRVETHARPAFSGDKYVSCILSYSYSPDRPSEWALPVDEINQRAELGARRLAYTSVNGAVVLRRAMFSGEEVGAILCICKALESSSAKIADGVVQPPVRDSRVGWLNRTAEARWIWDRLDKAVDVNADKVARLNSERLECDALQFTSYQTGGHYDFHVDAYGQARRQVSVVVMLENAEAGGDLEISGEVINIKPGDAVFFPSETAQHRVTPVRAGSRLTLVGWWCSS